MAGKIIVGVGFLLFSRNNAGGWELFVVSEMKDKPEFYKKRGMLTFPLETFEDKDVDYAGTIRRLVKEEIGAPENEIIISGIDPTIFRPIPGREEDVHSVYGYGLFRGNRNQKFRPEDDDVSFAGWWPIDALLGQDPIRVEVRPIMEHFAENHLCNLLG